MGCRPERRSLVAPTEISDLADCALVIEAVAELLDAKRELFGSIRT